MATNKFCMDKDEIQLICNEYSRGKTPLEIALKHFCSRTMIRNYLKRCGIQLRNHKEASCKSTQPVAMILHDWQSGMKADEIVHTYGFKNDDCLYSFIQRKKKQGYEFKRRKV